MADLTASSSPSLIFRGLIESESPSSVIHLLFLKESHWTYTNYRFNVNYRFILGSYNLPAQINHAHSLHI